MTDFGESIKRLERARLTGELTHNSPDISRHAIQAMVDGDPYWTYDMKMFDGNPFTYEQALEAVVAALGMTDQAFADSTEPFIAPKATFAKLQAGLKALAAAATDGQTILIATCHPGSMLATYIELGSRLTKLGAKLVRLDKPLAAVGEPGIWFDDVAGVICLSDEGTLRHTHAQHGIGDLIASSKPDFVVSDHSFAGAAIDAGVKTVAVFDTDDPAIPLAEALGRDVIAIPLNDNQTNCLTAAAARELVEGLHG